MRNTLSNAAEGALRQVDSPAAVLADRIGSFYVSQTRGVPSRTRAFTPLSRAQAGAKGAARGVKKFMDVMRGKDMLETGIEAGHVGREGFMEAIDMIASGRGRFANPIADAYTDFVFRLQGAGDAPARFAAFYESLNEQAELAVRGIKDKAERIARKDELMRMATTAEPGSSAMRDDMILQAIADSETAVFREKNVLAQAVGQFEATLGRRAEQTGSLLARAGQVATGFTLPFRNTPANVLFRLLQRAPVTGWVSALSKSNRFRRALADANIDIVELQKLQREMADAVGKTATGTALTLLVGMGLAREGLMTGSIPDSPSEREKWRQQGKTPNSILIDGQWMRLGGISPVGNLISLGAQIQANMDDPSLDGTGRITQSAADAAKAFADQSFLRGIAGTIDLIEGGQTVQQVAAGGAAGSLVPTLVADIAQAMDPTIRESRGLVSGVARRLPGVSSDLPARQNVFGEVREVENRASRFVDPFLSTQVPDDPISRELIRSDIRVPGTRQGGTAYFPDENPAQFQRRNRVEGQELKAALQEMFGNPRWRQLSREQRQSAVNTLSSRVRGYIRENNLRTKQSWTSDITRALRSAER